MSDRTILIYVAEGETWSTSVDSFLATQEQVDALTNENAKPSDFSDAYNSDFALSDQMPEHPPGELLRVWDFGCDLWTTGDCYALYITEEELEELESSGKPHRLEDYEKRLKWVVPTYERDPLEGGVCHECGDYCLPTDVDSEFCQGRQEWSCHPDHRWESKPCDKSGVCDYCEANCDSEE